MPAKTAGQKREAARNKSPYGKKGKNRKKLFGRARNHGSKKLVEPSYWDKRLLVMQERAKQCLPICDELLPGDDTDLQYLIEVAHGRIGGPNRR